MNLSPNLSIAEVTKSATAIKNGIDNRPSAVHLDNLKRTALLIFQPIRDHFGVPIGISSGYRSLSLNRIIGGSQTSQHSLGEALDLDADIYGGVTNQEIYEFIRDNLEFDQLIHEYGSESNPAWIHVSYREGNNRKQILRCYGRGSYKAWT